MLAELDEQVEAADAGQNEPPVNHMFCTRCNGEHSFDHGPYVGVAICGETAPSNGLPLDDGELPPNPCRECIRLDPYHVCS